jgi:hypothetical protein
VAGASSERVAGPRRAEAAVPDRHHDAWGRAVLVVAAASATILAAYLAHELYGRFIFPVGPDGPVYTWWIRYADSLGLDGVAPGRAGVPAAALILGTALGTTPVQTVMLLGPVLAATAGLGGAALVDATLGSDPRRAFLAALLTGTFAAYLAGGWLGNMAQAALFLGALTSLALAGRSWRPVWLGAALLAASGLAHWAFTLLGLGIIVGALLLSLPEVVRARRRGDRLAGILEVRVGMAAIASLATTAAGVAALAGGPQIPGDTSQDGFFRRTGLTGLLRDRYRERLGGDLTRMALPLAAGGLLATGSVAVTGREVQAASRPERMFLWRILAAWGAVTLLGVAVLAATLLGPANRVVVFAFVIPVAAAVGAGALLRRRLLPLTSAVFLLAAIFAGASMYGWYRQYPSFAPEELAAATRAGEVLRGQPPGTPIVFLVDTSEPAGAFHVTRFANVIRMGMPAGLIPATRLVVGRPEDLLAGRPSRTGDPEHDRIARAYYREAAPFLDEAVVLVLEPFNREGFGEAVESGRLLAPGIVVLQEPAGDAPSPPDQAGGLPLPPAVDGETLGLAPIPLVVLSATSLGMLLLLGLGWARWGMPGASRMGGIALAPAAGLGILVVAGFLTDLLAPGAASPWGLPVAGALSVAGYLAAVPRRGRRAPG